MAQKGLCCDSGNEKVIVLLSAPSVVKQYLTFGEVEKITSLLTQFILKNIKNQDCVGLLMNHNIYIPSLIKSLRSIQHPFVFLPNDDKSCASIVGDLGLQWLISFNREDKLGGTVVDTFKWRQRESCDLILTKLLSLSPNTSEDKYKNIFYIIRTSGTCGGNKYVRVTNYCIEKNIESLQSRFNLTSQDVIFFGTPLTFDPSMVELLLGLTTQACLVIIPHEKRVNFNFIFNILCMSTPGVTFLQMVPSLFLRFTQRQISKILSSQSLKILALGGEKIPHSILAHYKKPDLQIFNLYGITEVSCWATINTSDTIGCNLDETIIEIRNSDGKKMVEDDVEGEIFIGSSTRICLVNDEVSRNGGEIVYRATGDIGRIISGDIEYVGRLNDTVKRLGHRVNLSHVEFLIESETSVLNKCLFDDGKLLSFIVCNDLSSKRGKAIIDKIRVKLLHSLPAHYMPDFIEIVPRFPINKNGKIDCKSLIEIYHHNKEPEYSSATELFLVLIAKLLGIALNYSEFSKSTFFEIGGDSILAVQLIDEFNIYFELPPDLVTSLFERDIESCLGCLKTTGIESRRKVDDNSKRSKKCNINDANMKIRWQYDMKACVDSSPIVFNNNGDLSVAVGSFSHIFAILKAENGEEITTHVLPDTIEGSATYCDLTKSLYVGCFDGKLYCLNATRKEIKWTYSTADKIKCKPTLDDDLILIGSYDKYIHCVNKQSGEPIWKTLLSGGIVAAPIVNLQGVIVATISGTTYSLDKITGLITWSCDTGCPIFGSGLILDNLVIWPIVSGKLVCQSLSDGILKSQCDTNGLLFSSLVVKDRDIFCGCARGNLYNFVLDGDVLQLKRCIKISQHPISSAPCVFNANKIVVTTNVGLIFLIDLESGGVIGQIGLQGEVFSSPTMVGNASMLIGCRDNNLYCIDVI